MANLLAVDSAMRTSVGEVRERNEDSAYTDPAGRFFIVADGMGGQAGGQIASTMAVDIIRCVLDAVRDALDTLASSPSREARDWIRALLERAVRAANREVYARSIDDPELHGMGTTVDVVVILADEAFAVHVGDGRAYLFRDGEPHIVTQDHTVAEVMRRAGTLSDAEAATSPMRSMLCNAVGVQPDLEIEHTHVQLQPGDRLLVCTDGLYDYFEPHELAERAGDGAGTAVLDGMIATACQRGGHDNLTGVLIDVGDEVAVPEPVDRVTTKPMWIAARGGPDAGPFAGMADDALSAIVERVLRESSRQHQVPPAQSVD